MSNSALDNLFKQELNDAGFEYQESLWQQMDAQLQPVRQQQPDRRRRVAVWILLFLAAGGATWFISHQQGRKAGNAGNDDIASAIPAASQPGNKQAATNEQPLADHSSRSIAVTPAPSNAPATPVDANSRPVQLNTPPQQSVVVTGTADADNITPQQRRRPGRTRTSPAAKPRKNLIAVTGEDMPTILQEEMKEDAELVTVPDAPQDEVVKSGEPVNTPATPNNIEKPAKQDKKDVVAAKKPAQEKKKPAQSNTGYYLSLGTNWSSPFSKPGVFAGVLFTKSIGDKHLFAGIKLTGNHLDHQFTSAGKVNQTPVVTDAIIEKLTILQVPFGYEFRLNGKQASKAPAFLQVGFEPSFVTGLRTVFYDDNGIPGGPVTPVSNSPLLSKAINKFNVSFIAGLRKQFNSRLGVSLNAGYNLIDITDKQYYNRTTRNNNLRYLQAGLQWRINK